MPFPHTNIIHTPSPLHPFQATSSLLSTTTTAKSYTGMTYPKQSKPQHTLRNLALQAAPSRQSLFWLLFDTRGRRTGFAIYAMDMNFSFFTKHISQAMLATELFSRLNHNKIDLDTVALAHCQGAIPPIPNPTKKQALAALADEFYEYMSGLIHETPSQNTTSTDQQSNQRILQLEQQLAATQAQLAAASGNQDTPTPTKKRPPPSPSPTTSSTPPPPPNSGSKPTALPVAPSQATPADTPTPVPP